MLPERDWLANIRIRYDKSKLFSKNLLEGKNGNYKMTYTL